MTLRHLAAACLLTLALTACSDDEPSKSSGEESSSASESSNPDASLPAAVAEAVTPAHLDPVCPGGRFTEAEGVLGTLPAAYARKADRILTYDCDGRIDQVVWAELPQAVSAEGDEHTFVAGTTVVAVSDRLVDEAGLDLGDYFQALSDSCGCGVTSGP